MSNAQIVEAFRIMRGYGLETNALNIIGTPGETEKEIWDTIRLNRLVQPTSSGVNIFYPYHGTVLGDECFSKGLVNEELYQTFSLERRESVLQYSRAFRRKLSVYRQWWEFLVYANDIPRMFRLLIGRSLLVLRKNLKNLFLS